MRWIDDRHQLVRRVGDPLAIEAEHVPGLLHRPKHRPGQHLRPERHAPELELRDDPEVAAAAAHAPEEICVLVRARLHELALGRHEIDRDELVDREPVLAHDPADPAAEREPGDAGVRDDAGRHREPERLRLLVELARAGRRPARAPFASRDRPGRPSSARGRSSARRLRPTGPGTSAHHCAPRPATRSPARASRRRSRPRRRRSERSPPGYLSNEPFQILRCTS